VSSRWGERGELDDLSPKEGKTRKHQDFATANQNKQKNKQPFISRSERTSVIVKDNFKIRGGED